MTEKNSKTVEFTEQEIDMIYRFHEHGNEYAFDMWDYQKNKKENESITDYLNRQEITDVKIIEFMALEELH